MAKFVPAIVIPGARRILSPKMLLDSRFIRCAHVSRK